MDEQAVEPGGTPPTTADNDVRELLRSLDSQGEVAHLEARIADLESQLEHATSRLDEGRRQQAGELDLMRARIDEVFELLRDATAEQRASWQELDQSITTLVEGTVKALTGQVGEVRDEVSAQTQAAIVQLETVAADLRGAVGTAEEHVRQSVDQATGRLDETGSELQRLDTALAREVEVRSELAAQHAREIAEQLAGLEAAGTATNQDLIGRIEGLRRELDASAGELRATMALRVGDVTGDLEAFRAEVTDDVAAHLTRTAERETQWADALRQVGGRIEDVERRLRDSLRDEAAARASALDEVVSEVAALGALARDVSDRDRLEQGRTNADIDTIRSVVSGLETRVHVLQSTMAHAVSNVTSELANRVSALSGHLGGLREVVTQQQEEFAAVEGLRARVAELGERLNVSTTETGMRDRIDVLEDSMARILAQVTQVLRIAEDAESRSAGTQGELARVRELIRPATDLRQEVRDLTARAAELASRVTEAEAMARHAGQVVAVAVRRARLGDAAPTGPVGIPGDPAEADDPPR